MTYRRKTRDTWEIHVNYGYGHGWEHECTELSWADCKANVKTYRENCPYPVKVVRRREKLEKEGAQ